MSLASAPAAENLPPRTSVWDEATHASNNNPHNEPHQPNPDAATLRQGGPGSTNYEGVRAAPGLGRVGNGNGDAYVSGSCPTKPAHTATPPTALRASGVVRTKDLQFGLASPHAGWAWPGGATAHPSLLPGSAVAKVTSPDRLRLLVYCKTFGHRRGMR